jgi:hypothetical protein
MYSKLKIIFDANLIEGVRMTFTINVGFSRLRPRTMRDSVGSSARPAIREASQFSLSPISLISLASLTLARFVAERLRSSSSEAAVRWRRRL